MSAPFNLADLIKEKIESLPDLGKYAVLVDRQKEINSEFKKRISKMSGLVLVMKGDCSNPDPQGPLVEDIEWDIIVFSKPVIKSPSSPYADDVCEALKRGLHHWDPDPTGRKGCYYEMQYLGEQKPPEDASFLVNPLRFRTRISY